MSRNGTITDLGNSIKRKLLATTAGVALAATFATGSAYAQCAPVADTDNTFECSGPLTGTFTNDPDLTITILEDAEVDAAISPVYIFGGADPAGTTFTNDGTVTNAAGFNSLVFFGGAPENADGELGTDGNTFAFTNTGSWQGGVYIDSLGDAFSFDNSGAYEGQLWAQNLVGPVEFSNSEGGTISGDVGLFARNFIDNNEQQQSGSTLIEEEDLGDGETLTTTTSTFANSGNFVEGNQGGTASFTNDGQVGAEDNLVQIDLYGPSGASLENEGSIYTTNFSADVISQETQTTYAYDESEDLVVTNDTAAGLETRTRDYEYGYSYDYNAIGGEASFTNGPDALFVGAANVRGFAGANAEIDGEMVGNANISSVNNDNGFAYQRTIASYDENPIDQIESETDADGVTTTIIQRGQGWFNPTQRNDVYQATQVDTNTSYSNYVGGEATATILGAAGSEGATDDPFDDTIVSVNVEGASGASLDVSGSVLGGGTVRSRGDNTTYSNVRTTTTNFNQEATTVQIADGDVFTENFERTSSIVDHQGGSTPFVTERTSETVGGVASADISGALGNSSSPFMDQLTINGFAGAEADISGDVVANLNLTSTGIMSSSVQTDGTIRTEESSESSQTVTTTTATGSSVVSSSESDASFVWDTDDSFNSSSMTTGGEARLAISGTFGSEDRPYQSIDLNGFGGTSADLSGDVLGFISQVSSGSSTTRSEAGTLDRTLTESRTGASERSETFVTTSSENTFDSTETRSETSSYSRTYDSTGGVSELSISGSLGSVDAPGGIDVFGFGGANASISGEALVSNVSIRSSGSSTTEQGEDASEETILRSESYTVTREDDGNTATRSDSLTESSEYAFNESSSDTSTSTGGMASLDVSGQLGNNLAPASVMIDAVGGTDLNVDGVLVGNVSQNSDGTTQESAFEFSSSSSFDNTRSSNRIYHEGSSSVDSLVFDQTVESSSESTFSSSSSSASSGGMSAIGVSGRVGSETTPANVSVQGDAGASADISGTMIGNLYVSSIGSSTARTEDDADTFSQTEVWSQDRTYEDGTGALLNRDDTYSRITTRSDDDADTLINEVTGGPLAVDISGVFGTENQPGFLSAQSVGGVSADLSGDIIANVSLSANSGSTESERIYSREFDQTTTVDQAWTRDTTEIDGVVVVETSETVNSTNDQVESIDSFRVFETFGSTASLELSGIVGSNENPSNVSIAGQDGATADVTGTLNGNLTVLSEGTRQEIDESYLTTRAGSTDDFMAQTTEDGDVTSSQETNVTSDDYSRTTTIVQLYEEIGSDASVTNSSSDTITGDVLIRGDDNVELVNTGVIGGNAQLYAQGFASRTEETTVDFSFDETRETIDDEQTVEYSDEDTYSRVYSRTTEQDGELASLINSGTIGLDPFNESTGLVSIIVNGQDGAIVDNSGTANGNISATSNARVRTDTVDYDRSRTSESTTITDLTTFDSEKTFSSVFDETNITSVNEMETGGDVTVANTGIIAGNVNTNSEANSLVDNLGIVWGNIGSVADGRTYTDASSEVNSETLVETRVNGVAVTRDRLLAESDASTSTWSSTGGESVVNNSGSVGLQTIDPFFVTPNPFDDPTGNIGESGGFITSNGNAGSTVTNASGGIVLRGINSSASGFDQTETESRDLVEQETLLENGDWTLDTAETNTYSFTYVQLEVESAVVNDGQVGLRVRDGNIIGGGAITAPADIFSSGVGGSTVTNNGGVSGGLLSISNSSDYETAFEETITSSTFRDGTTGADNVRTTTEDISETTVFTAVGSTAEIVNSEGAIVGPEIFDIDDPTPSTSFSLADGLAGASITNDGEYNGGSIYAYSFGTNSVDQMSSSTEEVVTGTLLSSIQSQSEAFYRLETQETTGGAASIVNNNLMVSEFMAYARGFSGASVLNNEDAIFIGDVAADSAFQNTSDELTSEIERGQNGILLSRNQTRDFSRTWVGADASVVNLNEIWGDVTSGAFGTASVLNAEDAVITGDVSVSSSYANEFFIAENSFEGPTDPTLVDTFTETREWTGGVGIADNFGAIGGDLSVDGFQSAGAFNDIFATIGGNVAVDSLFENGYVNVDGVETEVVSGGTSEFQNLGRVSGNFNVSAYMDATLINTSTGWINLASSGSMESAAGQNILSNAGLIGDTPTVSLLSTWLGGSLAGLGFTPGTTVSDSISFSGASDVFNTGVINANLSFSNSWNDMESSLVLDGGSLLLGNIFSDTELNIVMDDNGLYGGNITGATGFTKSGDGRWLLTGSNYELGEAAIEGGTLQVGVPSIDLANLFDLVGLVSPLNGFEPFEGNTLINSRFRDLGIRDDDILSFLRATPRIDANLAISEGAAFEGQAVIVGDVANSGSFLPGYMLTQDGQPALENVLDNTNLILPGQVLVTGDFTQSGTGTFVTNFNPLIDRPELEIFGVQDDVFTGPDFALSVAPFEANEIPSAMLIVDGAASVSGDIDLYVKRGGLYQDGESSDILSATGDLSVDAGVNTSAESLFVDFGLSTRTAGGRNILSVVANRSSYGSFAETDAQEEVGAALDSALVAVANDIRTNNFSSVAELEAANDMAGFLAALDWNAASGDVVNAHLSDLGGSFVGALALIDTGAGFLEATKTRRAGRDATISDNTSFWLEGNFTRTDISEDVGSEGVEADTYNLSIGGDQRISDRILVGLAGGYSTTEADGDAGSNAEFDVASFGIYTNIAPTERWYIDAMLWGQLGEVTFSRTLGMFDRETFAETDVSEVRFDAEFGYKYPISENVTLTPLGGARVRNVNFGEFEELGAGGLGLSVNDYDDTAFQPFIGANISGEYQFDYDMWFAPTAGLEIMAGPDLDGPQGQFSVGGDTFRLSNVDSGDVVVAPSVGFNLQLDDDFALFAGYRGEFSDAVDQHSATLTARFRW